MGWCATSIVGSHPVLQGIDDGSWFYFLHSYALPVSDLTLATARHSREFTALLGRDNFVAAQFHPERSSADGARLLHNFLEWRP
jgi:glutamine amidotransferase